MFALTVTVYEIITFNISKYPVFESITLKIGKYHVVEYVVRWLLLTVCKVVWWIYLKLFLCGPQMRHSHERTHTYPYTQKKHTHTHTHTRTHSDESNRPRVCFRVKTSFDYTSSYLPTPLNIVDIDIVRPLRLSPVLQIHIVYAFHVCTCQCIPFESFTLKLKVKNFEHLDENWGEGALSCKYVQKLALLGPAVCSPYVVAHYVMSDARSNYAHKKENRIIRIIRIIKFLPAS